MKAPARLLLASLGVLTFAGVLYLGTRSGLRLHHWADACGLAPLAGASRALLGGAPAWVRYQLPDGLWQLAFGLATAAFWVDAPRSTRRTLFLAAPPALGLGSELAQGLRLIEGVFDPLDVLFLGIGAVLALALTQARRVTCAQVA